MRGNQNQLERMGNYIPFSEVMGKFKKGILHSGSDKGPEVKNRKQAVAIMLSEKKKADSGAKPEYKSNKGMKSKKMKKKGISTAPSNKFMERFNKAS